MRSVTRSLRQHLLRVPPRVAPDGLAQIDRHPFLLVLAVPVRAVQQQQVHNLHVAPHRRPVQRGVISEVKRVNLGALLKKKLARLEVPVVRGSGQRGILHDAALLDVGALVDEELAAGGVAVAGGEEHGGIAAVVSLVEGRALIVFVSEWVGAVMSGWVSGSVGSRCMLMRSNGRVRGFVDTHLVDVFLDPIVVPVAAISPDVGLVGDEPSALRRCWRA